LEWFLKTNPQSYPQILWVTLMGELETVRGGQANLLPAETICAVAMKIGVSSW